MKTSHLLRIPKISVLAGSLSFLLNLTVQGAFVEVDNFEGYTGDPTVNGSWDNNSPGSYGGDFNVLDDGNSNNVLTNSETSALASYNTGINSGESSDTVATLFFRFKLNSLGDTGLSVGITNGGNATDFGNYRSQMAFNSGITVYDSTTSKVVENVTLSAGTWYNIWQVNDNAANTYQVYMQGGAYSSSFKLSHSSGDDVFTFRNTGGTDLNTVMLMRGSGGASNRIQIDDIYYGLGDLSATNPVIPEPSSLLLVSLALAGVMIGFRRRR